MGKGYYHLEFTYEVSVNMILEMNLMDLQGAHALFSPWQQGFNSMEVAKRAGRLFKLTTIFPRLPNEYLPLLTKIVSTMGTLLEAAESMANRV